MKFEQLQPGMTVYDVGRTKVGRTSLTTVAVWPVNIISVDVEKRTVVARWNVCNPERTYHETSYKKWRKSRPE
ncbi:hypothetical protein [Rubrivivax gelatinosus]|uniref:hypothetical protein n=1 Tax=Rubrivivax gelatinosus TaxID=28068 RepID=UPI0005C178B5|nr:hypothetical protein [Rubrivivax gelatinosus]MBG6083144.1 hypothetical protein [Rubrivivax gelatinosus]